MANTQLWCSLLVLGELCHAPEGKLQWFVNLPQIQACCSMDTMISCTAGSGGRTEEPKQTNLPFYILHGRQISTVCWSVQKLILCKLQHRQDTAMDTATPNMTIGAKLRSFTHSTTIKTSRNLDSATLVWQGLSGKEWHTRSTMYKNYGNSGFPSPTVSSEICWTSSTWSQINHESFRHSLQWRYNCKGHVEQTWTNRTHFQCHPPAPRLGYRTEAKVICLNPQSMAASPSPTSTYNRYHRKSSNHHGHCTLFKS